MQKEFITTSSVQTKKLGEILAEEILADKRFDLAMPRFNLNSAKNISKVEPLKVRVEPQSAFLVCLSGDLGAGKTTFTQGLLKGLKIKGSYTSPTFVIMKKYKDNIFHFDAYRVNAEDILNLGWEEIVADPENIIIVEWADRIKKIIPKGSLWIKFEWVDENKRKVIFN